MRGELGVSKVKSENFPVKRMIGKESGKPKLSYTF